MKYSKELVRLSLLGNENMSQQHNCSISDERTTRNKNGTSVSLSWFSFLRNVTRYLLWCSLCIYAEAEKDKSPLRHFTVVLLLAPELRRLDRLSGNFVPDSRQNFMFRRLAEEISYCLVVKCFSFFFSDEGDRVKLLYVSEPHDVEQRLYVSGVTVGWFPTLVHRSLMKILWMCPRRRPLMVDIKSLSRLLFQFFFCLCSNILSLWLHSL